MENPLRKELGDRKGWLAWPRPSWAWLLILGLLSRVAVVAWGDNGVRTGPPATLMPCWRPTLLSMNRIVLASFPAFIDLAELLRPRLAFAAWLVASLLAQAALSDRFVNRVFLG